MALFIFGISGGDPPICDSVWNNRNYEKKSIKEGGNIKQTGKLNENKPARMIEIDCGCKYLRGSKRVADVNI